MKRKEVSPDSTTTTTSNLERMECQTVENPKKVSRQDPVQKDQKYDRQLRLWGNDGQRSLEEANICLVNATTTGTETLKCLILPGVGKYFIVDNNKVTAHDASNNFFVDIGAIGKPRAQVACELLQELNPDSVGGWIKDDPAALIDNDPEFFSKFSIVICSRVCEKDLLKISQYLWRYNIPLLVTDSLGYFGYLRVIVKEHAVIQAHPDNALEDLRLDCPFPELVTYFDNIKLDEMDQLQHSHTPYLVLLYKSFKAWQQQSGSDWPKNYKEKCQIKEFIKQGNMKNEDGIELQEENFEEALRNVNNTFIATRVPSDVKEVLDNQMANHPLKSETNARFWILVRALKEFVNQHGVLPLRGSLPDMFSDSKRYIQLQSIYKTKAENEVEIVCDFVREALADLQLPITFISDNEIQTFCKNAAFLKVQYSMSYHDEIKQALSDRKIKDTLDMFQEAGADIYLIFRTFYSYLNSQHQHEGDINLEEIHGIADELIKELSLLIEIPKDLFVELFRLDFKELHALSAIMGGLCAQEVIKLITKQFVPLDNTFVLNQITNTSVSMKL